MRPSDWLFADDAYGLAEYVIHRAAPRFIARLVDDEVDDFGPRGLTLSLDERQALVEIDWIDPPPDDLTALIRDVRMALAVYEERLEADVENADVENADE
jgi:hypothetical protein